MTQEARRPASYASRLWKSLDERLGLNALDYTVPRHGNTLFYMLGGITFFGFAVLILTGLFLTLYYDPNPTNANASVREIMTTVPLGSFVRSVHYWAAQAVVISVVLHMIRVFMTGSYKKPRELNWILGVVLLGITIAFFFTGTILKWDQESYQGSLENEEISHFLGPFGLPLSPDLAPNVAILARMYAIHVAILPIAIGVIVLGHLFYVHHFNISSLPWRKKPRTDEKEEPRAPFTKHVIGILKYGLVMLVILAFLAVAFPAPLGPAPVQGIEDATFPLWPLLPLTAVDDLIGLWWIIPATIVPFIFLLAVPFIDRSEETDPRRRKAIVMVFLLGVVLFLALLAFGIMLSPGRTLVGG